MWLSRLVKSWMTQQLHYIYVNSLMHKIDDRGAEMTLLILRHLTLLTGAHIGPEPTTDRFVVVMVP